MQADFVTEITFFFTSIDTKKNILLYSEATVK